MTKKLMAQYFEDRSFYQLQASALVDNPDQRIAADIRWGLLGHHFVWRLRRSCCLEVQILLKRKVEELLEEEGSIKEH
jgi:ABC-type uncharacterized transport system fused permease/ATPase subunit